MVFFIDSLTNVTFTYISADARVLQAEPNLLWLISGTYLFCIALQMQLNPSNGNQIKKKEVARKKKGKILCITSP